MALLERLKEAYVLEEDMVHRINYLLNLFLAKTDLPQQKVNEIRNIMKTLTEDSLRHKAALEKIIAELAPRD